MRFLDQWILNLESLADPSRTLTKQFRQMQQFAGVNLANQIASLLSLRQVAATSGPESIAKQFRSTDVGAFTSESIAKQFRSADVGAFTSESIAKQFRSANVGAFTSGTESIARQLRSLSDLATDLRTQYPGNGAMIPFASQARLALIERFIAPASFRDRIISNLSHGDVAVKRFVFKNVEELTDSEEVERDVLMESLSEMNADGGPLLQTTSNGRDFSVSIEAPSDSASIRSLEIEQLQARIDQLTALLITAAEQRSGENKPALIEKVSLVEVEFEDLASAQVCQKIAANEELLGSLTFSDRMLALTMPAYQRLAQTLPDVFSLFLCCLFDHHKLLGGADSGVLCAWIFLTLAGIKRATEE